MENKKNKKNKIASKKGSPESNMMVFQHNNLVEGRYFLPLNEKKILVHLISQIKPDATKLDKQFIKVTDFATLTDTSADNQYSALKKLTMSLRNRGLTIRNLDEGKLIQIGWIDYIIYHEKEGLIEFKLHSKLTPFLLELRKKFTAIPLDEYMGLRSIYSIRLYELLKQYENVGHRDFDLQELKAMLGIKPEQYKRYNDLKKNTILVAQKEFEERTKLFFEFEEIKRSRRVTGLRFFINQRKTLNDKDLRQLELKIRTELTLQSVLVKELIDFGFGKAKAKKLIELYGERITQNALRSVDIQLENNKVRNTKGMLMTALKEQWSPDKFIDRKTDKT